jgi:hypothetical protein
MCKSLMDIRFQKLVEQQDDNRCRPPLADPAPEA